MPDPIHASLNSQKVLNDIFPPEMADRFFEALLGDAAEGAYDITLVYAGESEDRIDFEFQLNQRPGRCLACNLTYGLPEVFSRHPVINVAGVVEKIGACLTNGKRCGRWSLGRTREITREKHIIPLRINLE
jgi:hypothetical protein